MLKLEANQLTLTLALDDPAIRAAIPALLKTLPAHVKNRLRAEMGAAVTGTGWQDLLRFVLGSTTPPPLPAFHKVNFHQIDRQGRTVPGADAKVDIRAEGGPGTVTGRTRYLLAFRDGPATRELADIQFYAHTADGTPQVGVTNEALLAIVIDRLEAFQEGACACKENESALACLRTALQVLHNRTFGRADRKVEGTHQP